MTTSGGEVILSARQVEHAYGGVQALAGVTLGVHAGEIVALIGPNGAGKSTFLECVSGAVNSYKGEITFAGTNVTGWPMYKLAQRGLIRSFQTSRGFDRMSVLSNLMAGAPNQAGERLLRAVFGGYAKQQSVNLRAAMELLERFELAEIANSYVDQISGGERRLVELCRTLMCEPTLLLLDEPFAGVSPENRSRLVDQLKELRNARGMSILMVEHRLGLVDHLCDRTIVMASGKVMGEGQLHELRQNPAIVSAYLGGDEL